MRHIDNGDDNNNPIEQRQHLYNTFIPATVELNKEDATPGGGGGGDGSGGSGEGATSMSSATANESLIRKLKSPSQSHRPKSKSSSSYLCAFGCFGTLPKFAPIGEGEGMATLSVPDVVPAPANDCQGLRKAFQGWGTDEKALIRILGRRNASQRKKIRDTYQELYKKSLIEDLHSELSGDFRKAIKLWTYDPPERDARLARDALQKRRKGVEHLLPIIEVACASSPQHLIAVRQKYCSLYACSLEEDMLETLSSPFRKLLVGLVSSFRYDKELVDRDVAKSEAALLHEAIEKKRVEHDHVLWILTTRNFAQLRATFDIYKQDYETPFDKDIMKCGNGDLESLFKVVVCCIDTPERHFAEVVRNAIVGLGTDEDSLSRAIVTRAEIDMMKIKGQYLSMYQASLDNAVIGDTSGDYRKFLLTLLGEV